MAKKILLAGSGSVAAVKIPELALQLRMHAEVRVVLTKAAEHFVKISKDYNPEVWKSWEQAIKDHLIVVYYDQHEWSTYKNVRTDPVVHIELRKWADALIIAPCSANTLAKLATGLCDNLLTCIARAWDMTKPFTIAPAMNTHMWSHPFTARHIEAIGSIGCHTIQPISKKLACGDIGYGALASVDEIVSVTLNSLNLNADLESKKLMSGIEHMHEQWCYSPVFLGENDFRIEAAMQMLDDEGQVGSRQYLALVDEASGLSFFFALFDKDSGLITKIRKASQTQDAEKDVHVPSWVTSTRWIIQPPLLTM